MAVKPLEIAGALKRTKKGHENWYYGGGEEAWPSIADAKTGVPVPVRDGQTVGVIKSGKIVEYIWHPSDTSDNGLVLKKSGASVSGAPGKLTKISADGESLEESGVSDDSTSRTVTLDRTSLIFAPYAPHGLGGLIIENKTPSGQTVAVAVESRGQSGIETMAYLSDITPPVDTTDMEAYEANKQFVSGNIGDTIYFTKDGVTRFFIVLKAFTAPATDPPNPDTDVTAGNLSETNQEKSTKIEDWKSGSQYLYSKNTVVSDPVKPILYKAKSNITGAVILTDTNAWRKLSGDKTLSEGKTLLGNADNEAEEADTVNLQGTNDISKEIFTVAYLTQNYGDYRPGEELINNQQIAKKTITSWDIKDINKPSIINIDLDDTAYFTVATGVLDASEVNTAAIINLSSASATATINKITGLVNGKSYKLKVATGLVVTVTHVAKASLSSGDFYLQGQIDLVLTGDNIISDFLEFEVINQFLIETNSKIY